MLYAGGGKGWLLVMTKVHVFYQEPAKVTSRACLKVSRAGEAAKLAKATSRIYWKVSRRGSTNSKSNKQGMLESSVTDPYL